MNSELLKQTVNRFVFLTTLLAFLAGCMPTQSKVGENGVVGHYNETGGDFETSPSSPKIHYRNMDGVQFDVNTLGAFIDSYSTINGCETITVENPVYLAGDFDGGRTQYSDTLAYVAGDGKVIYLAKGKPMNLRDVVHEFHHAYCQTLSLDQMMSDWVPGQKNFKITDQNVASIDTDVKVIDQRGFYLHIQVGSDEQVLTAMEEMAASMFMLEELNIAEPGWGVYPGKYQDLFQLTHDYLVYYGASSVTKEEMYETLRVGFNEGRGKSEGYTIVFNHLENLVRSKGVEVREDFKSGIIQYYYSWEKMSDQYSQSDGGNEIIASTLKNKWTRDLLFDLVDEALEGNKIAWTDLNKLTSTTTKASRNKAAREILRKRYSAKSPQIIEEQVEENPAYWSTL